MDNTVQHPTSDDLMHDMQVREKQANERTLNVEQERDELQAKMVKLKAAHQVALKTVVDQMEKYKALAEGRHGDRDDDDNDKDQQRSSEDQAFDRQYYIDELELHQNKVRYLERQLEQADTQHQRSLEKVQQDHQTLLKDMEQQLDQATHSLEQRRLQHVDEFTQKIEDLTERLQQTQKQVVAKDRMIGELEAQHHQHQRQSDDSLQHHLDTLQAQLDREHSNALDQQQTKYETMLEEQQQELKNLEEDKDRAYQEKVDELAQHWDEQQLVYDQKVDQLSRQLDDQQGATQQLETEKAALVRQVEMLEQQVAGEAAVSTTVDRVKQQLAIKADEARVLQAQVDQLTMDRARAHQQVDDLRHKIDDLQQQLADKNNTTTTHVDRLTRQVTELEQQLADTESSFSSTLDRLKQQVVAKTEQIQHLQAELDDQHQDLSNKSALVDRLTHTLDDLKVRTAEQDSTLDRLKKQVVAKTEQIEHLQAELDRQQDQHLDLSSKSAQAERLTRQVDDLRQQVTARDQAMDELERTSTTHLDRLKKQVMAKTDQVDTLQAELVRYQRMAEDGVTGKQQQLHIDRLTKQLEDLRLELGVRDEQEQSLTMALDRAKKQLAAKTEQVTALETDLDTCRHSSDRLLKQLSTAQQQLADWDDDRARYQQELADKRQKILQLQNDLSLSQQQQPQANLLERQHKAKEAKWQQEIDHLATQIETLTQQHQRQEARLTNDLHNLEQQVSEERQRTDDMRRALMDREDQLTRLQHDRAHLSTLKASQEKDQHISELEQAMTEMSDQLRKMSHSIHQVYSEKTAIEQQLADAMEQLQHTQLDFDRLAGKELARRQDIKRLELLVQQKDDERGTMEDQLQQLRQEVEVMQVTAASMEERSRRIGDLEDMVQVVQARLASAIDERDALRDRFGPVIDEITAMQSTLR